MTEHTASLHSSVLSETVPSSVVEPVGFMPSSVSAREQRAREQADRTINEFIEGFTGKGFFPLDCEAMIFSLLPQLTEWPADLQLKVVNEHGDTIATYLKGTDPSVIQNSVSVVQDRDGEYDTASVDGQETLFELILNQISAGSNLGKGGNFPGSSTTAGRIVTIREQLTGLLKSERVHVFDALLSDKARMKCDTDFSTHNRFLPLWRQQPTDRSPLLNMLLALSPEMPSGRFETLLEKLPLGEVQQSDFLNDGTLPDSFIDAWNLTAEEWRKDRGLDGIFHTRTYNADADALARTTCRSALKDLLSHELWISEDDSSSHDPVSSNASIQLQHDGKGNYSISNVNNDEVNSFSGGTDSFYLAIASVLQPHERLVLGMHSETDVAGFRALLATLAASVNGGWYDAQSPLQVKEALLPSWMKSASAADKLTWNTCLRDYRQAMIEAQAPTLPSLSEYGDSKHLRAYAKAQIEQRLYTDVGLRLDPELITVYTTASESTGYQGPPTGDPEDYTRYITTGRSLVDFSLENVAVTDTDYWLTAQFFGPNDRLILVLTRPYVFSLVRELDVGGSYITFLKKRLLTSSFGQWSQEQYAHVMDAQMRLDVIEAKMANDFEEDGSLQPERAGRGYKWVTAALDQAVDGNNRSLVEGHQIQVQQLKLRYRDDLPVLLGDIPVGVDNSITLDRLLKIAPVSSLSVPSMVVYTPYAPDGICFRKFSSESEMRDTLLGTPEWRSYLETLAPIPQMPRARRFLRNTSNLDPLEITAHPVPVSDLYGDSYKAEVQRLIDQIDAQTTSTSEVNWESAWMIASSLAELAIEFTPFKVRLPIAAARSIYALSQGARSVGEGDSKAVVHFAQAGLLLLDGLPGGKRSRAKPTVSPGLKTSRALAHTPDGLTARMGGVYNGVFEKPNKVGASDFYAQSGGKTFPIRYDSDNSTWRVIDPRRPDAYYKMPIRFDGLGDWSYNNIGLSGGGPGKGAKAAAKAAKASDTPAVASAVNTPSGGKKLFTLDIDDFLESRELKKFERRFPESDVKAEVKRAVQEYRDRGTGSFHPSAGVYTLDLPKLADAGGRGKWRLAFSKVMEVDKDGKETRKAIPMYVKARDIINPH